MKARTTFLHDVSSGPNEIARVIEKQRVAQVKALSL